MKLIKLTREKYCKISDEDFDWISIKKWYKNKLWKLFLS